MSKIKEISIKDLSDETLMRLHKFRVYDCDKIIIKINPNITITDIEKKILELNKICYNIINLICCQEDEFPMYSAEDHNNIWTDVDVDNKGRIESVTYNSEIISEIINVLISASINESLFIAIEEFIEEKLGTAYIFERRYILHKRYKNLNCDCEIEYQEY